MTKLSRRNLSINALNCINFLDVSHLVDFKGEK